jgi:hypothetical protein
VRKAEEFGLIPLIFSLHMENFLSQINLIWPKGHLRLVDFLDILQVFHIK